MKYNVWSIIFIGLGIICILMGVTSLGNQVSTGRVGSRIIFIGIILIVLSLIGMVPYRKSDHRKRAEKFNFRETDTDNNCRECSRFDMNSYDGFEADCKFFHIKTDEDHVCDLLKPQLMGNTIKSRTVGSNN